MADKSFEERAKLDEETVNKLTGQGKFKDTGRQSSGIGESLDSMVGVPVRTAIDQAQKGNFNADGAMTVLNSIGTDPQNAPTGTSIAENVGIENPYVNAALATAVDFGSQMATSGATGMVKPGITGSVKDAAKSFVGTAPTRTGLPEQIAQQRQLVNQLEQQHGYHHPEVQRAQGLYNTMRESLSRMGGQKFADGGEVSFDSLPSTPEAAMEEAQAFTPSIQPPKIQASVEESHLPDGLTPSGEVHPSLSFDDLVDDQEKYGTPGQQAIAGIEGVAKGFAGPVATFVENKVLGVPEEDILGRAEANPWTSGIGQAVGLGGGLLTGTGQAALMAKAGTMTTGALKLGQPVTYAARVGSAAVREAAEMAVLQSGDEISKQILNDPNASAESAIASVGLATALGGAGGAFMTGAVSPLWDATVGKQVNKTLTAVTDYLNGPRASVLPAEVEAHAQQLGIVLAPEMRAALSGNPKAQMLFNELREAQHPQIKQVLDSFNKDLDDAVVRSLPKSPEEIANYSEAEAGREAMNKFIAEYKAKYEPIAKEFDELTVPFKNAPVDNVQRATMADRVAQVAQQKGYIGPDIPQNKVVDGVLNRIEGIKTAEDFMRLNTTINNMTKGDFNLAQVARDMKHIVDDYHQNTLGMAIGREAPELMSRYAAVKSAYKDLAELSNQIGGELGLGRFSGPGTLLARLAEKRSPEQFLSRLTPKGNAEILGFLKNNFPETLSHIKDNEMLKILRPAVLSAKGESAINTKTLNAAIEKAMAGERERVMFALPDQVRNTVKAVEALRNSIPGFKSSGTAGWMTKMFSGMPASATAMVTGLAGHNPVTGYVLGHLTQVLGMDAPQAYRLAMLKFLASEQKISPAAFKSMSEYLNSAIKGQRVLNKAAGNLIKAGAQIIPTKMMPTAEKREELDKTVTAMTTNPEFLAKKMMNSNVGHYLPDHQQSMATSATSAMQYLASLKPSDNKAGPLDTPIPPSPMEVARYNRALDIANQPAIVLEHIKNGTLQATDIQDLRMLYPAYFQSMTNQLQDSVVQAQADKTPIPYGVRMGISMLIGQPLDSTMSPDSIVAAQMALMKPMQPQGPQGVKPPPVSATNKLNKIASGAATPIQAAESDKAQKRLS